jgi:hypothetical protein
VELVATVLLHGLATLAVAVVQLIRLPGQASGAAAELVLGVHGVPVELGHRRRGARGPAVPRGGGKADRRGAGRDGGEGRGELRGRGSSRATSTD